MVLAGVTHINGGKEPDSIFEEMYLWEGKQQWWENSVNSGLILSALQFTSSREMVSLGYTYLTAFQ